MTRRNRKRGSCLVTLLLGICLIVGLGAVAVNKIPSIFVSTKGAVEKVRMSIAQVQSVPFEEVKIPEDDVSGGYYYQQMNAEEQLLYKEMYQGIRDMSPSIYMHTPDMEVLKKVSLFIFCDRPEIFWCTGEMQVTSYSNYSELQLMYTCTPEEKIQRQVEIDAAAEMCNAGITAEMSEYDKIKYVFEYIVKTVDYNLDAPDNQNLYSALVGKSSVCAGYARATQYLLQRMGIECIYVTGTVLEQGAHAWNIVKCNGQYYQMDVTFGDPVFVKAESGENLPDQSINYDYLCCSDAEIMKNHTVDMEVTYPACNSMELNYYRLNNMYYEEFDPETILQDMNQSIYGGADSFTCKFANDTIYQEAHDPILNDLVKRATQNLLEYYGLQSVEYTYVEDPVMNKMIIFWNYQ